MSNMSYCKFENTYSDLKDCKGSLDDDGLEGVENEASEYEKPCVRLLIKLCKQIADDYYSDDL